MPRPAILVITGASGSGKTTLLRALEGEAPPGVRCHYFDSVGVPSLDQMIADHGSPDGWQIATTHRWISTLASARDGSHLALLEGQVRPTTVREAFLQHGVGEGRMLLLDCSTEVREARLRDNRQQPELATDRMMAWAAYLRGQADALHIPVLDTTDLSPGQALAHLRQHVNGLLTDR